MREALFFFVISINESGLVWNFPSLEEIKKRKEKSGNSKSQREVPHSSLIRLRAEWGFSAKNMPRWHLTGGPRWSDTPSIRVYTQFRPICKNLKQCWYVITKIPNFFAGKRLHERGLLFFRNFHQRIWTGLKFSVTWRNKETKRKIWRRRESILRPAALRRHVLTTTPQRCSRSIQGVRFFILLPKRWAGPPRPAFFFRT